MMKDDELWLKKIKERLDDYSEPLPDTGWERLEKVLPASAPMSVGKKKQIMFRRWAMTAAAVGRAHHTQRAQPRRRGAAVLRSVAENAEGDHPRGHKRIHGAVRTHRLGRGRAGDMSAARKRTGGRLRFEFTDRL